MGMVMISLNDYMVAVGKFLGGKDKRGMV